ncbi:hypothetical protein [Bradyrhizobium sp. USDA 4353]
MTLELRPLTWITGPLGSGKTRLAQRLAEILPDASWLGLHRSADGAAAERARLRADAALKSRVDETTSALLADGASSSDALLALITAVQEPPASPLVIDLIEQGLDAPTQHALGAWLRRLASSGDQRMLILLTRSSTMLDLSSTVAEETMILCPANHAPPIQVAPYPGSRGYEALVSCLASPDVRARTEGTIAWRPKPAPPGDGWSGSPRADG